MSVILRRNFWMLASKSPKKKLGFRRRRSKLLLWGPKTQNLKNNIKKPSKNTKSRKRKPPNKMKKKVKEKNRKKSQNLR